jgi:hypothetical protein
MHSRIIICLCENSAAPPKKRILYLKTYSLTMSILQLRLTFQLSIDDDMYLKYSHSDWVHHFVNHRPRIGFSHMIEDDLVCEYLNNVSVYFFRQSKRSMSSCWCDKRSYDYWITPSTLKFNYIVDRVAKTCIGHRRKVHIKIVLFLVRLCSAILLISPDMSKVHHHPLITRWLINYHNTFVQILCSLLSKILHQWPSFKP